MRKIINNPQAFVDEVMEGIFTAHPDEVRPATTDNRTLVRADSPMPGRVGIVTGGGSGHLPFFLGYVGRGLCSAVAIGNVFSSPSSAHIHAASRAVAGGAGLLYLYGNYGGDVYNFDLAADLCRAEGIKVETVLGADDILSAPPAEATTRRGVAGLVLVYKVAGAIADELAPLPEVARVAQKAVNATRTMGVGLSPTILPAAGEATFALDEGEMEIGIGIHGEQGTHRGPLESADEITDRFVVEFERELDLSSGTRVAVLVNGLGATPLEELYLIYRRLAHVLRDRGVTIAHRYIGEYVTSLEMAGASVSIMQLDDELERLMAAPASSPFFRQGTLEPTGQAAEAPAAIALDTAGPVNPVRHTGSPSQLRAMLLAALPAMPAHADELRELDGVLGDGDLGITISVGSDAVVAALRTLPEDTDVASVIRATASAFASANPSTFAALIGAGLLGALETVDDADDLGRHQLGRFLEAVAARIAERGGAQPGDKTLLDVIYPVAAALQADKTTSDTILQTAHTAVEETTRLKSKRGRAAWQGDRSIGQRDPGSVAILRLIEEIIQNTK
ncbi:dihydroxyacetone kinase family protein [Arthrobacter sp. MDT2-16]